jgi:L-threonylcarbamoyladenylate synthase
MGTERLPPDPAGIARAAEILRAGGLVALPTETVYGLGARADDPAAVRRIFEAKGRPAGNPLIVHVRGAAEAAPLATSWSASAEELAAAFWPGPLTLVVLRRDDRICAEVSAGGPTVALRVPAHPVARALLDACRLPIAAPSANRSTSISPTTADHVLKSLAGRIDAVLDGGPTGYGIESTIVDVTSHPAVILRHGAIPMGEIEARVAVEDRSRGAVDPRERAPAPGMYARHYAPRARVIIVPRGAVEEEARAVRGQGRRAGLLVREDWRGNTGATEAAGAPGVWIEVLPSDVSGYAAGLYAALHRLDDAGCDCIVVEAVSDDPAWTAIRDRLCRAAAPA